MSHQPIVDLAELCAKKGVREVVLCPGSRCAPLTLAFTRNSAMKTRTFSDERSAAFIGLGIAQEKKEPVILVCTSGSAAYNFAPAIAEAWFSQIPLIVFTADRPAEWIGQHDGQTIYQPRLYGRHVKASYDLPQDYDHPDSLWAINRIVNEAINLSRQEPCGPVHINTPFREPLYPAKAEKQEASADIRVIEELERTSELSDSQRKTIKEQWTSTSFNRILIVAGQGDYDEELWAKITECAEQHAVPVVADIISNPAGNDLVIRHSDLFLGQAPDGIKKSLQPDLLITFGKSLISKNLKLFLRKYAPARHWHIQEAGIAADTFRNLTQVFHSTPLSFFSFLSSLSEAEKFEQQKRKNFSDLWQVEERRTVRALDELFPLTELNELEVVRQFLENLPRGTNLHLANSMSVRYANFFGVAPEKGIRVYANRGTSGIDGCTSTAVGHALASSRLNVLITGDVAFFYDRNAFWHNYPMPNLRIILLNNHGGVIFNMIDGPASQPEAAEYFITRQALNATRLCEEFGFDHLKLDNRKKLKNFAKDFFEPDNRIKILEVETDVHVNRTIFDTMKKKIKDSYAI